MNEEMNLQDGELQLETEEHSQEEELEFLKELEEEEFDPEASELAASKNDALHAAGAATATTVLGVSEQLIKQFGHKDFAFEPSQVENVANAAAPLFVKYGGEMPPWLAQYREEIMFTFATGTLCFTSFAQVKALKQADAVAAAAKEVKETQPEPEVNLSDKVA